MVLLEVLEVNLIVLDVNSMELQVQLGQDG
jgi:hypothetical protein